jgi:hypothetical protein
MIATFNCTQTSRKPQDERTNFLSGNYVLCPCFGHRLPTEKFQKESHPFVPWQNMGNDGFKTCEGASNEPNSITWSEGRYWLSHYAILCFDSQFLDDTICYLRIKFTEPDHTDYPMGAPHERKHLSQTKVGEKVPWKERFRYPDSAGLGRSAESNSGTEDPDVSQNPNVGSGYMFLFPMRT